MLSLILYIADGIIRAYQLLMVVYCVSTWVIRDPFNKFLNILRLFIDPVLDPIRAVLSKIGFLENIPFDFSFLIAYILCSAIRSLI